MAIVEVVQKGDYGCKPLAIIEKLKRIDVDVLGSLGKANKDDLPKEPSTSTSILLSFSIIANGLQP